MKATIQTLTIAALISVSPSLVFAQAIADNMTCSEAVSYYERNGRIYKRNGKDVIPIYNGVPVSKRRALHCNWGYMEQGYSLKTKDKRRCTVSYRCVESGGWDR